jgi:hypothetical protein
MIQTISHKKRLQKLCKEPETRKKGMATGNSNKIRGKMGDMGNKNI